MSTPYSNSGFFLLSVLFAQDVVQQTCKVDRRMGHFRVHTSLADGDPSPVLGCLLPRGQPLQEGALCRACTIWNALRGFQFQSMDAPSLYFNLALAVLCRNISAVNGAGSSPNQLS